MTTEQDIRQGEIRIMTRLEWGVLFSVIVSAASLIFSAGVVWTTVQTHDRDIATLKAKDAINTDRLARIETKLDLVLAGQLGKVR